MTSEPEEYWFCLVHHTVEGRDGCPNADRLGPYATAVDASKALETVAERNAAADAYDKWDDQELED